MSSEISQSRPDYHAWLGELKSRFRQVQLKAAVAVNTALLQFYWELGADIVARQAQSDWGSGFLNQLSADLMHEFPEMKGFSASNLKYIRQWYAFYVASPAIGQQAVGQLAKQAVSPIFTIPWGHNLAIIAKCKQHDEALHYAQATQVYGWSTLRLLLCKSKDRVVAEYALSDIHKPMGISEYTLSHPLPESLRDKLPSIETIERELGLDEVVGNAGAGV